MSYYITAILLLPLISFLILTFSGERLKKYGFGISFFAHLGSLILSITIFFYQLIMQDKGLFYEMKYPWITPNNFQLGFSLTINNLGAFYLFATSFIGSITYLFYYPFKNNLKIFPGISLFTFSIYGIILSGSLFNLYIFYTIITISSFVFYNTVRNGLKKIQISLIYADILFLLALLIIFSTSRDVNLVYLFQEKGLAGIGYKTRFWSGLFIFLSILLKIGFFPFNILFENRYEMKSSFHGYFQSTGIIFVGIFVLLKLFPLFPPSLQTLIAFITALLTLIMIIISCNQTEIRKIIQYINLVIAGLIIIGIGSANFLHSSCYLLAFIFVNTLLYFIMLRMPANSNIIAEDMGENLKLEDNFKASQRYSLDYWALLVTILTIVGLPLFSMYSSRTAITVSAFIKMQHNPVLSLIIIFLFLTYFAISFSLFRLFFAIYYNNSKAMKTSKKQVEDVQKKGNPVIIIILMMLCFYIIFHFPGWNPIKENTWISKYLYSIEYSSIDNENLFMILAIISIVISILGMSMAFLLFVYRKNYNVKLKIKFSKLLTFFQNELYISKRSQILYKTLRKFNDFFVDFEINKVKNIWDYCFKYKNKLDKIDEYNERTKIFFDKFFTKYHQKSKKTVRKILTYLK